MGILGIVVRPVGRQHEVVVAEFADHVPGEPLVGIDGDETLAQEELRGLLVLLEELVVPPLLPALVERPQPPGQPGAATLEESRAQRRFALPTLDWITAGLCVLAWLANPWGVRALEYPFQYLDGDSPFRDILEWHPPAWTWDPRSYGGRFAWMTVLAAAGMPRGLRRAPALAALAAVAFAMAATSRRFIPVFAVAATPLVAIALSSAVGAIVRRWRRLDAPATRWALTATAAVVALLLWRDTRLTPDPLDRWTLREVN